jgi:DNA-binding LacI/PurR family transcriptional regulator
MPIRMKDIASDLGVSVCTVSKALRNSTGITSEMRARVLQCAQELHYKPNLTARALTGRTGLIQDLHHWSRCGYVLPGIPQWI